MVLARHIEDNLGITVSIGLSYNKFLAKVASDFDKPRGFSVFGRAGVQALLAARPVSLIWGVGKALQQRLEADGLRTIGQLAALEEHDLIARYGSIGRRLARFARGQDDRTVDPSSPTKSVSAETTFAEDLSSFEALKAELWPLCETVAGRLKGSALAGRTVTLKLKTAEFRSLTRSRTLAAPTQLAEVLFQSALPLLKAEAKGQRYRLSGIGVSGLGPASEADPPDLLDPEASRRAQVERAIDFVRAKLGEEAIVKGRAFALQETRSQKSEIKRR